MVNQNIEIDIDNDYSKTHLRYYNYNFVHGAYDAFSYELVTYRSVTEIYKKSPELEKYKAAALLVAFQLKQLIRVYWIIYICLPFPFRLNSLNAIITPGNNIPGISNRSFFYVGVINFMTYSSAKQ